MADDQRQRQKNLALFFMLLGLTVLLFFLTILKVSQIGH